MNSQQQQEAWFDAWLDAKLEGRPLPSPDSDPGEDVQNSTDSANRLHAMVSRFDRRDHVASEQDRIWNRTLELVATQRRGTWTINRFRPGWSAVVSTLVAAVVILAIVAGFRRFEFGHEAVSGNGQFGESGASSGGNEVTLAFGENGCAAEPIDRDLLLGVLTAEPMSRSQRSTTVVEFDEGTVSTQDVEYFATMAESFYTCLYLGRPMSALQFATEEFIRDWVMGQVVFTYGVVTLDQTELYVDLLVDRELDSASDGFRPIGETFLTPEIRITEWLETTDGRVHLSVDWVLQGANDPSRFPANVPDVIVISRAESGSWGIDSFGSEIVGG